MAEASTTTPSPLEELPRLFGNSEFLRTSVAAQADGFWRTQGEILGKLQCLSQSWFERRRAGTEAAMNAAQAMCCSASPSEAVLAYQRWLAGSIERLTADGVETQAQIMNLSQAWLDGLRGAASAYDAQTRADGRTATDADLRSAPRSPGQRAA